MGASMAWGQGGRFVIAGADSIVEYLPDGRPNLRFGVHGRLLVRAPAGTEFNLAAVAADSEGRILVAGTSQPAQATSTPGPPWLPGPLPEWASVMRYLPNGKRDTSFGNNGIFDSTLSLPPPLPHRDSVYPFSLFEYETPSVGVTGLTVDAEDRPILTGYFTHEVQLCYPGFSTDIQGSYVARLTAVGAIDSSFDDDGVLQLPDMNYVGTPVDASGERLVYLSLQHTQCLRMGPIGPAALGALTADGSADTGFGSSGSAPVQILPNVMALDRVGGMYFAGPPPSIAVTTETLTTEILLTRLFPNGALDTGFGHRGFFKLPSSLSISALAVDREGRILLAGQPLNHPQHSSAFSLIRMKRSGELDREFGHRGEVRTGFGKQTFAIPTEILIAPRNRILLGGQTLVGKNGVAVARYLGGK